MLIINNEIDLGQSFEKLKGAMQESKLIGKAESFGYMQAYFNLEKAVENHIKECTVEQDANDIKDINI